MRDGRGLEHGCHLGGGHWLPRVGEVAAAQRGLRDVASDALASGGVEDRSHWTRISAALCSFYIDNDRRPY